MRCYQFKILQNGVLPLQLDGRILPLTEHVCTVTLVWPEGKTLGRDNSLIIDPCFSERGMRKALRRLLCLGASLDGIGQYFVTHEHRDHMPTAAIESLMPRWNPSSSEGVPLLDGIHCHPCPGHSTDLVSLSFDTNDGECWIVGDAILSSQWFRHWGFYWPNRYTPEQIAQTWQSVSAIVSSAAIIIPGHGGPFQVTHSIIQDALNNWPQAAHRDLCPEVERALRLRLENLRPIAHCNDGDGE